MESLEAYQLEKWVWTDADFELMGWHDSAVYTWRLNQQLALDIDYIFQWNQPAQEGLPFTFWVAPATLVFANVQKVEFDFDFFGIADWKDNAAELDGIEREGSNWTLQFQHGYIAFEADGYTQYIRQAPSFQFGQQVGYQQRGGTSLAEEVAAAENQRFAVQQFVQSEEWRLYQVALKRARVRHELNELLDERAAGKVELKDFLLRRRDLQDRINYLGIELRATQFENW